MSTIFISYSRRDRAFVELFYPQLADHGFSVWYDSQIPGGEKWLAFIIDQIRRSQLVIAILSPDSINSEWVNLECGMAIGLGKPIIPLLIDPSVTIPSYLATYQAITYHGPTTIPDLSKLVSSKLQHQFWYDLFQDGLDICVGLREHSGVESANCRTMISAFDFHAQVLNQTLAYLYSETALRVNFFRGDTGQGLDTNRNWIILGGPGDPSHVHNILINWSGAYQHLEHGYRFVTQAGRFKNGPFLRDADDDRLGIEDIKDGTVAHFHERTEATRFKDGTSYSIMYTTGFSIEDEDDEQKIIILAAFERYVLDGTVSFLLDDKRCDRWMKKVQQCGPHTETLLTFSYNFGRAPQLCDQKAPRTLGKGQPDQD
ncbi:MAG: toll/interleukin-1 receptor domain-containing protein [Anaerolineae bacterium]|nr:toll/interleukin-1 receptor domain-containing protein [Anaerolineae bacterium]